MTRFASLLCALMAGLTINLQAGPLYAKTAESDAKIVVHEGGSGSGKTYSLLQFIGTSSFEMGPGVTTVTRESVPRIKLGPYRDWKRILFETGMGASFDENKTDRTWTNTVTGHMVEFTAFDNEEKAKGPRRKRLFVNEATEHNREIVSQLMGRTSGRIFIDYNPSLIKFWVDSEVLTRSDVDLFKSTYKDNPFLPPSEREEIENHVPVYQEPDGTLVYDWQLTYDGSGALIRGDAFKWAVYGLGRRGSPKEAIYPFVQEAPFPPGENVLGLDFGFEHPMSLNRVARIDEDPSPRLHIHNLFHRSGYTVPELVEELPGLGVGKDEIIICDNSRPDDIKILCDAGYNAVACEKGAGSVLSGIGWIQTHRIYLTPESVAAKIQFENYRRKKVRGEVKEEPLKYEDDAPDSVRYAAFDTWGRPPEKWGAW